MSAGAPTSSAGIIRTIGQPERRFAEDKLRMLRAVRFAARFGYQIDPATFEAIRALRSEIHQVSRERVRDEIVKMLTEGHARRAFELLDQTGLLKEVLPGSGRDARRRAAAAVPSRGRRVGAHAVAAGRLAGEGFAHAGHGARCCTMWASRRLSAWRPTASASTATWRWA